MVDAWWKGETLRWGRETKWAQVEKGLGRRGLTGILCSAIKMLLRERMRGYDELNLIHTEQVEVYSQRGQVPTCLSTDGAIHVEEGRGVHYSSLSAPTTQDGGSHTRLMMLLGTWGVSIFGASMNPSMDPSVPWILGQSRSRSTG